MYFNDTPLDDQNWEDFRLTDKYTHCVIESPDLIDYDDCVSMIMRNELMFGELGSGNDSDYRKWCREHAGYPAEFPRWFINTLDPESKETFNTLLDNKIEEFNEKWNRNPSLDIFTVDLFASQRYSGPSSFVNLKSGKVGNVTAIGKWDETIGESKEEILWFAKTYPQYKFFLTFKVSDDGFGKNRKNAYTLMLFNGKVTVVKTRTNKETDYVYRINHYYGSTLAKRPGFITRFIHMLGSDSLLYKIVSKFIGIRYRVRVFYNKICNRVMYKLFPEYWYSKEIEDDERFRECNKEKFFDKAHARDLIVYWKEMLRKEKN